MVRYGHNGRPKQAVTCTTIVTAAARAAAVGRIGTSLLFIWMSSSEQERSPYPRGATHSPFFSSSFVSLGFSLPTLASPRSVGVEKYHGLHYTWV